MSDNKFLNQKRTKNIFLCKNKFRKKQQVICKISPNEEQTANNTKQTPNVKYKTDEKFEQARQ